MLTLNPEERQQARKQRLNEYCLEHTFNKNPTIEELEFVSVDGEPKLVYCVMPKVATKTWRAVIAERRGIIDKKHTKRWVMWRKLGNYTDAEKSPRLKAQLKFLFVREPLHRLLSAYKDRLANRPHSYTGTKNMIERALRPLRSEPEENISVSFPEFIQYFSDNKTRNQHWRHYEKLCHPCVINYDFIGHLETLEEDAALLLKMAGIDDRMTFPAIHKSTGSSEVLQYYSQVPPEYINRIGQQYRSDFEMFGYEYLGPVKQLLKRSKNDSSI